MVFSEQDWLTKVLEERIEEYENLQAEYDKINRNLDPVAKSDLLEELLIKIQLILSLLLKSQRGLLLKLEDISSYMYRSDIEDTLKTIKEYIKSYQGMALQCPKCSGVSELK